MSDKVSYTKHLTATEAEFENFQANSICEEEFITLSDLVSPQDQLELPESGLENSDIGENLPYEQNVVYDDLPLSVETIEFAADNTINKTWLENPNPTTQHLSSVESIERPHFKIQGEGCSNKSEFIKKSINAVTKSGRGRGRGSRGLRGKGRGGPSGRGRGRPSGRGRGRPSGRGRGEKGQKILNVDTFVEKTAPSPSLSNETIEQTSSANPGANVTSTMNNLTDCEKKRKRGRPKSVIQNGTTTTSVAEIKSCDDLLRKDIKGTKIKMRGRKGKACRMEENISPINVNTEDVTNTENTNKNKQLINDHNEITLQNDIIDSSLCFVQKEPLKKKGRKSKTCRTEEKFSEINVNTEVATDTPTSNKKKQLINNEIALQTHDIDSSSIFLANEAMAESNHNDDDICLSKIKSQLKSKNESGKNDLQSKESSNNVHDILTETFPSKTSSLLDESANSNVPKESDKLEMEQLTTSPIIMDSKRSSRNRNKPIFKYDESESEEEDPFANIELSDDEPNKKKNGKCNIDYEYLPYGKQQTKSSSDSDDIHNKDEGKSARKRKFNIFDKNGKIRSPKKKRRQKLCNANELKTDPADIEDSLKSSVVLKNCQDDITDFLAKKIQGTDIKIFKANSTVTSQNTFEIPIIDPNKPKKCVEISTQTNTLNVTSAGVQTDAQYDRGTMKQVTLSSVQANKACDFLKNIVSTTAELGELMTLKSQEFISKKINTENVTDTLKMDYCVKKSFQLFKLAMHNLLQMEDELSNQYEEFLKINNLLQYRQKQREITPKPKDDSDCEIVEVPHVQPKQSTSKVKAVFNPRTVFLNKELSIKIAKKAQEIPKQHKDNIIAKGKRTVWLNDSVMVKKVKPTQSFLALDSLKKKPPDCVTLDMVKKFFREYTKQKMLLICKKLNSIEWLHCYQEVICNYFIKESSTKMTEHSYSSTSDCQIKMSTKSDVFVRKQILTNPKTLFTLCVESFQSQSHATNPKKLFTLCVESFQKGTQLHGPKASFNPQCFQKSSYDPQPLLATCIKVLNKNFKCENEIKTSGIQQENQSMAAILQIANVKTLKLLCLLNLNKLMINVKPSDVEYIASKEKSSMKLEAKSLSTLCFLKIKDFYQPHKVAKNVKTLSFICLQVIDKLLLRQHVTNSQNKKTRHTEKSKEMAFSLDEAVTIDNVNCYVSHADLEEYTNFEDNSESHYADQDIEETSWVSKVKLQDLHFGGQYTLQSDDQEISSNIICNIYSRTSKIEQIKIEPLDESETITALEVVKVEPADAPDNDAAIVPSSSILTKEELELEQNLEHIISNEELVLCSYDVNHFESFVQSHKMIKDISTSYYMSQSDEIFSQSSQRIRKQYDPDSDEENINSMDRMGLLVPQNVEQAKDDLLENSSNDGDTQTHKSVKKKPIRSKSGKKITKDLSSTKEKHLMVNEVKRLTKKMKGRLRQEEKRHVNCDSDSDTPLLPRKKRQSEIHVETMANKSETENINDPSSSHTLISDKEIQCNDVDSTECMDTPDTPRLLVAEQKQENSNKIQEDREVPSTLIECEPDIFIRNSEILSENGKVTNKNKWTSISQRNLKHMQNKPKYIERSGWYCYNIDHTDSKLYDQVSIVLEKLPESFVQTYNRFQGLHDRTVDDTEVDRLVNLNSLHRSLTKDKDPGKCKEICSLKKRRKMTSEQEDIVNNEDFAELTPSEEENEKFDVPVVQETDNCLAKNLLLGEIESDSEEVNQSSQCVVVKDEPRILQKYLIAKSENKNTSDVSDVFLTADIMMNKELALLHTAVTPNEEVEPTDSKDLLTTKNPPRTGLHKQRQVNKDDPCDDSSSEEEKQWVNTKEKLLKRLERKQEDTHGDEARGAKRVSEFIEKCGDGPEVRPRPLRCRSKRSHKKKLEKRKQMNFLVEERSLESGAGKRTSQAYGRGRRNIRKVIDKKSLQRDTVKANMQEFERKQQLAHRLRELRERLGCEDAVNVVVINGELCLQYDVERNAPVASVHAHFTGVMKAHQYEGVKFMWDACFETVERVSEGHPGSGCILAHCMGLGKTLQVLALLHTVLTHPTLKMRRVLVCCPLSTVLNWVDEIHKWMGPVTDEIKVFELSKFKKTYERAYQLEDWYSGGGIFIIGYELFRTLTTLHPELDDVRPSIIKKIRTALLDPGPDVIVCDEGHLLKNDSSVLALAMNRVSTNRRIVLTGTPMQNNLREYYCMVNFIKPHLLGTYHEFSNRFENPIMNGQHRDSREDDIRLMKTRTHILHKVLEGCLQRQEASVLHPYLPKKYEYTVFIPLTECQKNMYKHYLDAFGAKGQQMLLKDFHTLQKIWTHPQVLHNFQTKSREEKYKKIKVEKLEDDLAHEDITASEDAKPAPAEVWWLQYLQGGNTMDSLHSSSKFQVVFNLLDECVALGDKILIFSTSLFTMDTLEYFLRSIKKWSLGHDYYRLDGSVPAEVRQKWCREFNAPQNHRTKLFLISTRAGSLGLNMTAANRVIILDTSWNPAHDIQSIFRVYRFGQKKDCFIYRLVAMGTMEQKMYERSVSKQAVSCRVVDEQQIDRHYNSAELTELYSWDEEGWGILAGIAPGVRDPALLRVAAAGAVHAVREHDSMLRGSEPALPEDERAAAWQQFQLEHAEGHRAHAVVAAKSLDDANRETDAKRFADTGKAPASTEPKAGASEHLAMDSPQDVEHGLVKKIMQILISHKFHETAKPDEVIDLVANIKRLVISGMSGEISRDEPVAASIAAVLLKDLKPAPASPPPPVVSSGARRGLREVRRAALAAERTFEILNDECSTPGDDVDWEAGDERKRKPKKPPKEVPPPVASCIVISDDEIEAPRLLAQEKKNTVKTYSRRIKMKVKESSIEKNKIATARGSDDAEAVPLHASLLTDVNFVKIVAHTYLKGNPMLAEDAALMAARYSTDKALKELQASGVPITAGPIYDIAISVLGKALLEKMHQSNGPSTDTSDVGSSASSLFRDAQAHTHVITDDEGDSQMAISKETSRKKTFAGPRSRKPQVEKKLQPKGTENPANSRRISNNVFPVSNCIGPGNPAESSRQVEECILPDDDDVIVASPHPTSSIPTPTPVSLLRSARPTLLVGHQSSKLLPSTSTSSDTYASTHTTAVGGVPATHRGDAGGKATSDVGAGSVTESILPESEPICLSDSDDEPTPSGPAPLLVHSASFKANTPFVLPPVVRSSLEPKKKYMYIPLLPSPYPTSNDTVPGVNAQSAPSSANSFLTSSGPMKVQCSASAPSHPRAYGEGTRTKRTAADLVVINDHGESKAKKKTSGGVRARPLGTNLPQNCVANADVPQVQTLDEDSLPTATPDDDPLSILKNVVHIQAPRWDTVEAKRADEQGVPKKPPTKPIVIQRNLHGEGSSKLKSFIAKKTPAPIGTQAKGQPETKTHILELLKRLEKAKWANANFKSSLKIQPKSEKVAAGPSRAPQTAARAAPKRQLNSFIDLTERQPTGSSRVDDRGGASSCSKREVKKPKRLLTLADFNLDDLSEITELE